jgi:hypothetical protein
MRLEEFRSVVTSSEAEDWHRMQGWETYLYKLGNVTEYDNGQRLEIVDVESHHSRAVYQPDIAIGIAWGLPHQGGERFHEDWTERFADEKASAGWLDLLYHGQPVDRRLYVLVDGARCKLPLPEQIFAAGFGVGPREKRLWVTRRDYELVRLVNELDSGVDYDRYLRQAGFDVPDE